ncbi:MAG: BON domain-containing protein [Syntrophorhabdales bacterium]
MPRIYAAAIFFLLAMTAIASCRSTAPAQQAADDAAVTAEVKKRLLNDEVTRGLGIGVETVKGVVTLTGSVDSDRQRRRAAIIASNVGGCRYSRSASIAAPMAKKITLRGSIMLI